MPKSPKLKKRKSKVSIAASESPDKSIVAIKDPIPPIWIPPPVDLGMKVIYF